MLYVRCVELVGFQVCNRVWSGGHRQVGETAGVGMACGVQREVRELPREAQLEWRMETGAGGR